MFIERGVLTAAFCVQAFRLRKMKYEETENTLQAFIGLFSGENLGK